MIGYLMINHEYKFIFIHIPKCAGMSIGRTLYNLVDKDPKTYEGFKIHHDEFDEKIWKEYFVFTFLRNPLDRLYSQYRYRDFLYEHDFEYAVKNMKRLYEEHYNFKVDENKTGSLQAMLDYYGEWIHLPSQKEFLQGKYSNQVDKRPYIDFYGKYETLQEDFDYVCEKIGLPKTKLLHENKSKNEKDFNYEQKLF
tara:strand:+ start:44 stop:628 length:585 start_codon:yes stop_codon:yes gene_type:complete